MPPLVSVIIPHWNHREILAECLDSLKRCTYPHLEILVVDNHSTDDSVEFVGKNYPEVTLIQNATNRGFAGGCNDGAMRAAGDYFVILNNDTTQDPDWIDRLVEFMESNPAVGIAQPKLINAKDPDFFDYSGAAGGFMDRFAFPFARGRILDTIEQDTGQYGDVIQIFWASGTACILRKTIYEQIGLFDETFFAHMEEIDFDWRAQLAGWDVAAVPSAVVYHHSGFTLPPESPFKKYLNHRNSVYMLLGNYNLWHAVMRSFQRFLLDGLALAFSLFSGDFSRGIAILKAWWWIVSHPGDIIKKRKNTRSIRHRTDSEMDHRLYPASIALEHSLFKRKYWDAKRHAIEATGL